MRETKSRLRMVSHRRYAALIGSALKVRLSQPHTQDLSNSRGQKSTLDASFSPGQQCAIAAVTMCHHNHYHSQQREK